MTHREAINRISVAQGISQADLGIKCGYSGKNPASIVNRKLKSDPHFSSILALAKALGYEVVLQPVPADPTSRAANQMVIDGVPDGTGPSLRAGRKPLAVTDTEPQEVKSPAEVKEPVAEKDEAEKNAQNKKAPSPAAEETARPCFITPDGKFVLTPVGRDFERKAESAPEPATEEVSGGDPAEAKELSDADWNNFLKQYARE